MSVFGTFDGYGDLENIDFFLMSNLKTVSHILKPRTLVEGLGHAAMGCKKAYDQ